MIVIHIETADKIIADAGRILRIVPEHFKGISVEPVESIFCPKPKEPFAILYTAEHCIVGEPILYLVVPEIVGLTHGAQEGEKENGKYKTLINQLDIIVSAINISKGG